MKIPAPHHLAYILSKDTNDVSSRYKRWLNRPPAPFNYESLFKKLPFVFGRDITMVAALGLCRGYAAEMTSAAMRVFWENTRDRKVECYRNIPFAEIVFRKDVRRIVLPPTYFVEDGIAKILWVLASQERLLPDGKMPVLASLIRYAFAPTWLANSEVEIVDLSALNGSRRDFRIFESSQLTLLPDEELEELMGVFAKAYDALAKTFVEPTRHKKRKSEDQRKLPGFDD